MTLLLTQEERNSHYHKAEIDSGPFVVVDELLKHQLAKVIAEIEAIRESCGKYKEPYAYQLFDERFRNWLKAAKKETG